MLLSCLIRLGCQWHKIKMPKLDQITEVSDLSSLKLHDCVQKLRLEGCNKITYIMLLTTGKLLTSKQWGQYQDLTSYEDWGLPFWIWLFNKGRDCIEILSVCCWLIQMFSSFKVTSLESCNTEWAWNIHNLVISAWWIICRNICPYCPLLAELQESEKVLHAEGHLFLPPPVNGSSDNNAKVDQCVCALIQIAIILTTNGCGSESALSMCQSICLGVCLRCLLEHMVLFLIESLLITEFRSYN